MRVAKSPNPHYSPRMQPTRQPFKQSHTAMGAKYEAHHRGLPLMSMLKMVAAGMLIDRFNMKSPVERALVYGGLGLAMGYAEKFFRDRKERDDRAQQSR
jgi:hypothetical protein